MNLYRRLDAIPMRDVERWRARIKLERAELYMEWAARVARAVNYGFRALIVRPLNQALEPNRGTRATLRGQAFAAGRTRSRRSQ